MLGRRRDERRRARVEAAATDPVLLVAEVTGVLAQARVAEEVVVDGQRPSTVSVVAWRGRQRPRSSPGCSQGLPRR